MKHSLETEQPVNGFSGATRRQAMKHGLGLTLGSSALGLAGLGTSTSAQAWGPWHTTRFLNNDQTKMNDPLWAVYNSLASQSELYRSTGSSVWTATDVYWRNSNDAMWKDGYVRFYDQSGEIQKFKFNFQQFNNPMGFKDINAQSMTMSNTKTGQSYSFSPDFFDNDAYRAWKLPDESIINKSELGNVIYSYRNKVIGDKKQYEVTSFQTGASWAGASSIIFTVYKILDDNGRNIFPRAYVTKFQVIIGYVGWSAWWLGVEGIEGFDPNLYENYYSDQFLSALSFSSQLYLDAGYADGFKNRAGYGWTYFQSFTEPTTPIRYYAENLPPYSADCNKIMAACGFLSLAFGPSTSLLGKRAAGILNASKGIRGMRDIALAKNYPIYFGTRPVV